MGRCVGGWDQLDRAQQYADDDGGADDRQSLREFVVGSLRFAVRRWQFAVRSWQFAVGSSRFQAAIQQEGAEGHGVPPDALRKAEKKFRGQDERDGGEAEGARAGAV